MALIIKGDMPKGKCWWHDENGKEHECQFFPCGHDSSYCPILGEIPDEHGDLKDTNKIIQWLNWKCDNQERVSIGEIIDYISNAPTVVEATK